MRTSIIAALAFLLHTTSAIPAPPRYQAWQWQRPVEPAGNAPAAEQCVVLDGSVYAAAAPGLRDVRLLQNGREIAYALEESYDEPALHQGGTAGKPQDRSLYTTVLTVPLVSGPGGVQEGSATLPRHVPVERLELVRTSARLAPVAVLPTPAAVHLHLLATPLRKGNQPPAQQEPTAGEVIDAELDASSPVALTVLGANLQNSAEVTLRVGPTGAPYTAALLQMHQRTLCYQPLTTAPLLLLYGNLDARPVRYDYAAHFHPAATPLLAHLGPATQNPTYHPRAVRTFAITRVQRLTLAVGLALAVFLLTAVPLLRRR